MPPRARESEFSVTIATENPHLASAGVAMEFRHGVETAARPEGMKIADMIEQQGVKRGISRLVHGEAKVRTTAWFVNRHRQTDHRNQRRRKPHRMKFDDHVKRISSVLR
jgi:hypothetical protein